MHWKIKDNGFISFSQQLSIIFRYLNNQLYQAQSISYSKLFIIEFNKMLFKILD